MWYLKVKRTGMEVKTVFHDMNHEIVTAYREDMISRSRTALTQPKSRERAIEWTATISRREPSNVQEVYGMLAA